jgi:2-methylcitrate dehydratase PrpD
MTARPTIAAHLAGFAADITIDDVPDQVLQRARHLILDAVGVAFAASVNDFPACALEAVHALGSSDRAQPLLGLPGRVATRDAAFLNGLLIHGLDFDDTHTRSLAHVTAAVLPAALAAAVHYEKSIDDLVLAYVVGIEVAGRIGAAASGHFHAAGFHSTGVVGAFGAAVASAVLAGLDAEGITTAQGIVGSTASGILEFLNDGSWTKRAHAGWAARNGVEAAALASSGWSGPPTVYEGRYGLFATHLGGAQADPAIAVSGLGDVWETMAIAVKPYPACHLTHSFIDAALNLVHEHQPNVEDIVEISCGIHPGQAKVVCEPLENKLHPQDGYDARFSLPYIVSAALVHGRFTLDEVADEALSDQRVSQLMPAFRRVRDPLSSYPEAYSGVVELKLRDGRRLEWREQVNRGHETRPITEAEIVEKFRSSLSVAAHDARTGFIEDTVLESHGSARELAETCAGAVFPAPYS